jgi:hypothetical protein
LTIYRPYGFEDNRNLPLTTLRGPRRIPVTKRET